MSKVTNNFALVTLISNENMEPSQQKCSTTSDRLKCIYIFALPFRVWKYLFHRDLIVLLKYIFYSIYLWRWYLTENSLFVFTVVRDEVSIKVMFSDLTQPGFLLQPYMALFKALQLWLYSSETALSIFYIQSVAQTVYKREGKKCTSVFWLETKTWCEFPPVSASLSAPSSCSSERQNSCCVFGWVFFPPQPKRK